MDSYGIQKWSLTPDRVSAGRYKKNYFVVWDTFPLLDERSQWCNALNLQVESCFLVFRLFC